MILYDLIVYRHKNAILSPNNRCLLVNCAQELMPTPAQVINEKLPLYVLMEQSILRQFMVATPYDLLPMAAIFVTRNKIHPNLQSKFNLFAAPGRFFASQNEQCICPEVRKILLIYFIMAYKFTGWFSQFFLNLFSFQPTIQTKAASPI
jgi:hypothetical protein